MAKQNSATTLRGSIGNVTYFQSKSGSRARAKSEGPGARLLTDPKFQRVRENMSEFSAAGRSGKTLRNALRVITMNNSDNRVTPRLFKRIMQVIKTDQVNDRGFRNVMDGDVELLQGFEFNEVSPLTTTVAAPYTTSINRETGGLVITIPSFVPGSTIVAPVGATHFKFLSAGAEIDFVNDTSNAASSSSQEIAIGPSPVDPISLNIALTPNSTLPIVLAFGIEFWQSVNSKMYRLNGSGFNAVALVAVSPAP